MVRPWPYWPHCFLRPCASRLHITVTLMFTVYFSVLWLVSNVSKFNFNNTTENNTFINTINVK